MIERFLERLKELPEEEQAKMADSLQDSGLKPVITTAFDLSSQSREHILSAIQVQFGDTIEGRFTTAPNLICGIELKANGHKIAWSLANYLDNLADNLPRALQDELPQKQKDTGPHG